MSTQATTGRAAALRSRDFLGRDLMDRDGSKLGGIRDLLLDRRSGTIRFLEVDLGMMKRKVLVPVRHIEWGEDAFVLRSASTVELGRLPHYDLDLPITGEMLDELTRAFPRFYDESEASPLPDGEARIVPISRARDFRVPKDEPDLKGWTVFGGDGERVGRVADLLVDPAAMKVAYLVVDVMDDLFLLKDDRHILVPTDAVELRERGKDVWVDQLTAREIARLPAHMSDAVDPLVVEITDAAFHQDPVVRVEPER